MALHGDFSSFPLPELLQWLDSSRKTGTLQLLSWEGGERSLFLLSGQVLAVANEGLRGRVARVLALAKLADGAAVLAALKALPPNDEELESVFQAHHVDPRLVRDLVREEMLGSMADQTRGGHGAFHWTEDLDRSGEEWAPCEMGLRELLFESLRWVDEQPDVDRVLPGDALTVRSLVPPSSRQPLMHRILLTMCVGGQNLGRLRLSLGLSRSSTSPPLVHLAPGLRALARPAGGGGGRARGGGGSSDGHAGEGRGAGARAAVRRGGAGVRDAPGERSHGPAGGGGRPGGGEGAR